jgi:tRNA A-37 threonylcarbamoyl transferase component Bud32
LRSFIAPSACSAGKTSSADWAGILEQLRTQRVIACQWDSSPAYAKSAERPHGLQTALMFFFAPLLRKGLGYKSFTPVRRAAGMPFEVRRLTELRAAGFAVPRVLASTPSAFVMSEAGIPLEKMLTALPPGPGRRKWFMEVVADLCRLHQGGQWHGGAQVRNMAVSSQGLLRFDFDRALDAYFPLPMLQAHDAALLFSSIADFDDAEALGAAARLYVERAPTDTVEVMQRMLPAVRVLASSKAFRLLAPKEARRVAALHAALAPWLGGSVVGAS